MKYIDIHCHPSLKPMFSLEKNRLNCWTNFNLSFDSNVLLDNILDSQSSLSQLIDSNVKLAVVALHPLEMGVATRGLLRLAARLIKDKYLDRDQLKKIGNSEITYDQLLSDELENLKKIPIYGKKQIKIISSIDEYDDSLDNVLHLILSIEGGHAFFGDGNDDDIEEMLDKLVDFKTNENARLLFVTMTHLCQNNLANHAYGIKIFSKESFIPLGNGLTIDGMKFINTAYNNTGCKRVLIDIKHLSLKSRFEFYKFRKEKGYEEIPIVASHVAVTGLSLKEMRKYIADKKKCNVKVKKRGFTKIKYKELPAGHLKNTFFNPTSINLYDEDILEIVKSEGIIGLIIDQRVLGVIEKGSVKEFVSNDERELFVNNKFPFEKEDVDFDEEDKADEIEESGEDSWNKMKVSEAELHTKFLLNNIIHIYSVVKKNFPEKDPWGYMSLATDFDGLVNPIDSCVNITELELLAKRLSSQMKKYFIEKGINDNPDECIHKFLYQNALEFLKINFTNTMN